MRVVRAAGLFCSFKQSTGLVKWQLPVPHASGLIIITIIIIILIIIIIIIIMWGVYVAHFFLDYKESKHFPGVSEGPFYGASDNHYNSK